MKQLILAVFSLFFSLSQAAAVSPVLDLHQARQLADAAFSCAVAKNIKISVAVVNAEGNLLLFYRGDGSYSGSIQAAIDKARSANAFRRPTKAFTEAVKTRPELLSVREIVAVEGGIPVVIADNHLGAIGISGGRAAEDHECAQKALEILK